MSRAKEISSLIESVVNESFSVDKQIKSNSNGSYSAQYLFIDKSDNKSEGRKLVQKVKSALRSSSLKSQLSIDYYEGQGSKGEDIIHITPNGKVDMSSDEVKLLMQKIEKMFTISSTKNI